MKEWRWRRNEGTRDRVHKLWARKKMFCWLKVLLFSFFIAVTRLYEATPVFFFFCLFLQHEQVQTNCINTALIVWIWDDLIPTKARGEETHSPATWIIDHCHEEAEMLKLTLQIFWRSCWCTLGFIGSHIDLCSFPSVELTVFLLCTSWAPST